MAGLMVSQCKSLCACWVNHINHTDSNYKGAPFLIYLMLFFRLCICIRKEFYKDRNLNLDMETLCTIDRCTSQI